MFDLNAQTQHITSGTALTALGLPHRIRIPAGIGPHPTLIMVHGLDGNEDVTWVFARTASPDWLILTPRAPLTTESGFSWYPSTPPDRSPDPAQFAAGSAALDKFIAGALATYPIDPARVVLIGFSQGAALSYDYAFKNRDKLIGLGALAGFIPPQIPTVPPLTKLPVLVLHGTQDERVPIEYARNARERLTTAGAALTYEESDVGHKLSAQGMRTLAAWLAARLA
jgi:phospholipase/carboxylesterase